MPTDAVDSSGIREKNKIIFLVICPFVRLNPISIAILYRGPATDDSWIVPNIIDSMLCPLHWALGFYLEPKICVLCALHRRVSTPKDLFETAVEFAATSLSIFFVIKRIFLAIPGRIVIKTSQG